MTQLRKSKRQLRQENNEEIKKKLIDLILEEIVSDYRSQDYSSLQQLLTTVITNQNSDKFISYLSEDKISEFYE
jgi:hypothetical protein